MNQFETIVQRLVDLVHEPDVYDYVNKRVLEDFAKIHITRARYEEALERIMGNDQTPEDIAIEQLFISYQMSYLNQVVRAVADQLNRTGV